MVLDKVGLAREKGVKGVASVSQPANRISQTHGQVTCCQKNRRASFVIRSSGSMLRLRECRHADISRSWVCGCACGALEVFRDRMMSFSKALGVRVAADSVLNLSTTPTHRLR